MNTSSDFISCETHNLVVDSTSNNLITDEKGQVLIQNSANGDLLYVSYDTAIAAFEVPAQILDNINKKSIIDNEKPEDQNQNLENRNPWTKSDILQLIDKYEKHLQLFKSTTVKNDKVWHSIAKELKTHNWEQCKNKFKYLKSKYIQKKENMGCKSSGASRLHFEYFDQMDKLFGNDPNIKPVAIASSSISTPSTSSTNIDTSDVWSEEELISPKKRKIEKNKSADNKEKIINQLKLHNEILINREESRKQRHKELLNQHDKALDTFKEVMDKFIDKMK